MSTYKVKWYNVAAVPLLAAILGAVAAVNTARVGGTTTLLAGASAVAVVGAAITLWIRARLGARVTVDADGLGFRGRTWDRVLWTSYGTVPRCSGSGSGATACRASSR